MTILTVAGLSRCGSSLTMQMLRAGGMVCVGDFPAFEVDEINHRAIDRAWLAAQDGKALKWLDPHHTPWPAGIARRTIWLTRDHQEQARSQIKFAQAMFGARVAAPDRRRWAASLRQNEARCLRVLEDALVISFEDLLAAPVPTAGRIARFALPIAALDEVAMARAVRPRPSGLLCAPGLDMELALMAQASP